MGLFLLLSGLCLLILAVVFIFMSIRRRWPPDGYYECDRPSGDGRCSDNSCPCDDTVIPRGTGYLYIDEDNVKLRQQYPRLEDARRAMREKMDQLFGGLMIHGFYRLGPILCCKEAARRRDLDLETAAADAEYYWETGLVPLRPTPLRSTEQTATQSKVTIPCAKCGAPVKVLAETVGKRVRCPKCREVFVVPPPREVGSLARIKKQKKAPSSRKQRSPFFYVVSLVCVASVVCILIGLLVPAIGKVREAQRRKSREDEQALQRIAELRTHLQSKVIRDLPSRFERPFFVVDGVVVGGVRVGEKIEKITISFAKSDLQTDDINEARTVVFLKGRPTHEFDYEKKGWLSFGHYPAFGVDFEATFLDVGHPKRQRRVAVAWRPPKEFETAFVNESDPCASGGEGFMSIDKVSIPPLIRNRALAVVLQRVVGKPGDPGYDPLTSPDPQVRLKAIRRLREWGSPDAEVVSALTTLLGDSKAELGVWAEGGVWREAVALLSEVGPAAAAAVPILLKQLANCNATQAAVLQDAIVKFGVTEKEKPLLLQLLGHEKTEVRDQARTLLGKLGPAAAWAVPDLIEQMIDCDDKQASVLQDAIVKIKIGVTEKGRPPGRLPVPERTKEIDKIDITEKEMSQLLRLLRHEKREVRARALMLLDAFRPIPLKQLANCDAAQAEVLQDAIVTIGVTEKERPVLLQHLRHANPEVRARARTLLGKLGPAAAWAVLWLIWEMANVDATEAVALQALIVKIGATEKEWVLLCQLLRQENPEVRARARTLLGKLGPAAAWAVPDLLDQMAEQLAKGDAWQAEALQDVIVKIGVTEEAMPRLHQLLMHKNPEVAAQALKLLARLEPTGAWAASTLLQRMANGDARRTAALQVALVKIAVTEKGRPLLRKLLRDPNTKFRELALTLVAQLGPEAALAVPDLLEQFKKVKTDTRLQRKILLVFRHIGPKAEAAAPVLAEYLAERAAAAKIPPFEKDVYPVLKAIGPAAVKPLLARLTDKNKNVRWAMATALGQMDAAAKSAIPALTERAEDAAEDDGVRGSAREAIERIRQSAAREG